MSPAAVVSPAAITIRPAAPDGTVKTLACAVTVTVVGWLDLPDSAADTVAVAPFSEIDAGITDRVTVGVASSSSSVSVAPVTLPAPRSLDSVAVTVAVRLGSSTSLSTAVIAAVSVAAVVAPAAITMVASGPTV